MAEATLNKLDNKNTERKVAVAVSRYVHISPRKTRLIADLIRGKSVASAIEQLRFIEKGSVEFVLKTLLSAVANAENNFHLDKQRLKISKIKVDLGPVTKRWKPRAHGRASEIHRPTSHIYIEVEELVRPETKSRIPFPTIPKRAKRVKEVNSKESKDDRIEKPEQESLKDVSRDEKVSKVKGKGIFSLRKKLFTRKGGEK